MYVSVSAQSKQINLEQIQMNRHILRLTKEAEVSEDTALYRVKNKGYQDENFQLLLMFYLRIKQNEFWNRIPFKKSIHLQEMKASERTTERHAWS